MILLLGWGAYARDKNTSARLCGKKAGGLMHDRGAYLWDPMKSVCPSMNDLASMGSAFSEKLKVVRSPLMIFWGQNWSHQCSPLPEGPQKLPPEGASPQSHHAPLDLH